MCVCVCIRERIKLAICIPKRKITWMNVPVAEQYLICGYKALFSCKAGSFIMAGI